MADVRVAIIGAGIGGLTMAIALRQRGIQAAVFEQASELREVGAAVAIAANGTRILRRLGVLDEVQASSAEPTELIYRHWQDGRRLVAHPVHRGSSYRQRYGAPFCGIHRVDLQRILSEATGDVRLGHRLTELAPVGAATRVRFAGGAELTADVVVGADGVHSAVRRWVTEGAAPAKYSGTSGFRGLVPVEALPSLPEPGAIQFWMGPGAHLLHYPIGAGEEINFLAVLEGPARWHSEQWMTEAEEGTLHAAFAGWHPAAFEMIDAVPQSPRWGLFAHQPLRRWSRGGVVLLGDAAHAMLPHHGQGANQTIEDAYALTECLAQAGSDPAQRDAALLRYERLRRVRTRLVQRSSWVTSDLLHLDDGVAAEQRDRDLAWLPARFGWIHQYDVAREFAR